MRILSDPRVLMTEHLTRETAVDLGDEREVHAFLCAAGFEPADILEHLEAVIDQARVQRVSDFICAGMAGGERAA